MASACMHMIIWAIVISGVKEVNLKVSADTAGSVLLRDKPSFRLEDLKNESSCRNYVNRIKSQIVKIGISKEDPDSVLK